MAAGLKIVNGDFVVLADGTVDIISGSRKCARDFEKMLKTISEDPEYTATKRYNPYYGTRLHRKELFRNLSKSATVDVINQLMEESISYYIKLQEQRSNLSVEEVIKDIQYFTYPDPTDQRYILIDIKVTNGNGQTVLSDKFSQEIFS